MKHHGILFNGAMVRAILDGRKTQTRRIVKFPPQWLHDCSMSDPLDGRAGDAPWPHCLGQNGRYNKMPCPCGPVGRKLWVRETWAYVRHTQNYESGGDDSFWEWEPDIYGPLSPGNLRRNPRYQSNAAALCYAADGEDNNPSELYPTMDIKGRILEKAEIPWRPSIHMPQWAARIWLEVTEIRCQRLQDIIEEDAVAEGVERTGGSRYWLGAAHAVKGTRKVHESACYAYRDLWNSIYLPPAPVYGDGKRIVSYVSYPWAAADFKAVHPEAWTTREWKGRPLTITSNPWVWAYTFKRIEKP